MRDFYRELGRLIRDRRKAISMSQATLAANVGLSRTSITNVELGRQHLALHLLYGVANTLSVDPSQLLPDKKYLQKKKTLRFDQKHLSPNLAQTVEGLYQLVAPKEVEAERSDNASDKKS